MDAQTLLEVKNLKTIFKTDEGLVKAVDGVSFTLERGQTIGLVGESGCGKSVTNLSLLRLIYPPGRITGGEVLFKGRDILKLTDHEVRAIRGGEISMIFQDPMTSLNPFLRISTQLTETIRLHQHLGREAALEKAVAMLGLVGIPAADKRVRAYPHQFSGGMRQRVMIAMALSCEPDILIADEPTTALDVTIQAQIFDIIKQLLRQLSTALILVTHDLGVVAGTCDTVHIMYAGRIVESADCTELFARPLHPYTRALLHSIPAQGREKRLAPIPGQPPNMVDLPDCCPFFPRCAMTMEICRNQYPPAVRHAGGSTVSCWLYRKEEA